VWTPPANWSPHVRPAGHAPGQVPFAPSQLELASRHRHRLNVAGPVTQIAWQTWSGVQPPAQSPGAHGPRGATVELVVVVPPGVVVVVDAAMQPHSTPLANVNESQTVPAGHGPTVHAVPPETVAHVPVPGTHWQKARVWRPLQSIA